MTRLLAPTLVALLPLAGCASVRTEGVAGPVAWRTADLALAVRTEGDVDLQIYSFALILQETAGVGITLTGIRRTLYFRQVEYTGSTSETTGRWRLSPHGELRLPFSSSLSCTKNAMRIRCPEVAAVPPAWQFVFTGNDDRGQPVRLLIDVELPRDPRK